MKEYDVALKNYPMKKVSQIVGALRDIDVKVLEPMPYLILIY
jgi:DNA polymerase-3 subunit delta